jgi:cytoplasmic iron level regulating protein YaaA (DUF328/UPF0246 family)
MPRINEHEFRLENIDYKLTFYRNENPIIYENEKIYKGNKSKLLRKYINSLGLGLNLYKLTTQKLSDIVLKHFSSNTFKIKKTVLKTIKLDSKSTLINSNSNSNPSNSKDNNLTLNNNKIFLIPCSSSKISKKELEKTRFKFKNLSFHKKLGKHRKKLIKILKISECEGKHKRVKKDTKNKQSYTEEIKNEFIFKKTAQAHKLYSKGKYYHRNSSDSLNWTENDKEKIYIVSALFGIIKANNYIPLYNFAMGDEVDNQKNFAKTFWKGKLDLIIIDLINKGYSVCNLLSKDYSYCLNKSLSLLKDEQKKFKGRGEQQGKWLKKQLK